jgi:hypothetical protein
VLKPFPSGYRSRQDPLLLKSSVEGSVSNAAGDRGTISQLSRAGRSAPPRAYEEGTEWRVQCRLHT